MRSWDVVHGHSFPILSWWCCLISFHHKAKADTGRTWLLGRMIAYLLDLGRFLIIRLPTIGRPIYKLISRWWNEILTSMVCCISLFDQGPPWCIVNVLMIPYHQLILVGKSGHTQIMMTVLSSNSWLHPLLSSQFPPKFSMMTSKTA